jgi:type IV secretory pathway VirB2 component (pilin)
MQRLQKRILTFTFILALLFPVSFFVQPQTVSAAPETCQCYCGSVDGAYKTTLSNTENAGSACAASCKPTEAYVGCFTAEDINTPENNTKCWEEQECLKSTVIINGKPFGSDWGESQPTQCVNGQHYCYTKGSTISLGVLIPKSDGTSASSVAGIGEYVQLVYTFLLGAGSLLAVLMVMIGGLQWVMARGNQTAIGNAKERMSKAIMGIVLLFGAVTIMTFIDPSLTKFEEFRVPKIQQSIFVDKDSGCEALIALKGAVTLDRSTGYCGDSTGGKATITAITSGKNVSGLEVGDTCNFQQCKDETEQCIKDKSTNETSCQSCLDIDPDNEAGIPPTPFTCAEFSKDEFDFVKNPVTLEYEAQLTKQNTCFYSQDSDLIALSLFDLPWDIADAAFTSGTCAQLTIDCTAVTECRDYLRQEIVTSRGGHPTPLVSIFDAPTTHDAVCIDDPCSVGPCRLGEASIGGEPPCMQVPLF